MTRILILFIASCAAVAALVGCNSGRSEASRIVDRIERLLRDANLENLQNTMENYSFDYCDDVDFCGGGTYLQEQDCWRNTFNDPSLTVRFTNLRVLNVQVDPSETQGTIDAIVTFTLFDGLGNFIGQGDYSFRMFMIKEGNSWLMWGDGNCTDGSHTVQGWKDRLTKETRAGQPPTRKSR